MPLRERPRPLPKRPEPPRNSPMARRALEGDLFHRIIGEIPNFMEKAMEASDLVKKGVASMRRTASHTRLTALTKDIRVYEPDLRRRALGRNYRFNFKSPEWRALSQLAFELGVDPERVIDFLIPSKGGKSKMSVVQLIGEFKELIDTYKQAKGLNPNAPFHALPKEEWLNIGRQLNASKISPKQLANHIMKQAMQESEN